MWKSKFIPKKVNYIYNNLYLLIINILIIQTIKKKVQFIKKASLNVNISNKYHIIGHNITNISLQTILFNDNTVALIFDGTNSFIYFLNKGLDIQKTIWKLIINNAAHINLSKIASHINQKNTKYKSNKNIFFLDNFFSKNGDIFVKIALQKVIIAQSIQKIDNGIQILCQNGWANQIEDKVEAHKNQ